jgi:hypothetical protein
MNKELLQRLYANQAKLKAQKMEAVKFADPVYSGIAKGASFLALAKEKAVKVDKAEGTNALPELKITVIGNLSGWMDSQDDVICKGAYSESIAEKGINLPFLKDHSYRIDAILAKTLKVYAKEMAPSELGIATNTTVMPEALIFEALISPKMSGKAYYAYKNGAINQHSIGLRYRELMLAINDPDYSEEFKVWNAYKNQVLNMEKALDYGYFWAVPKIDIIENSAVVFGANSKTPTLAVEEAAKAETKMPEPKKNLFNYL